MSQISSAHKVENMNKTVLQQLQTILDFCEKNGHQPEPASELGVKLTNVQHLILVRGTKGIAIPEEITSLFAKIKNCPTAGKHKRKELRIKEAAEQNAQKLVLKQKFDKIQNLTSHNLNIFKFICGDKKFESFLNTNIDPIITKTVLDYFYAIYYNPKFSLFIGKSVFSLRARYFIELYVGDYTGKNVNYLKEALSNRKKERDMSQIPENDYQQLVTKIGNKEPLTQKEIGYLACMAYVNVGRIMKGAHKDFYDTFKNFESLLDSYIEGDASAVMSKIPARFAVLHKYQQDNNLQEIPTDILNSTGKALMEFFAENISTKQH